MLEIVFENYVCHVAGSFVVYLVKLRSVSPDFKVGADIVVHLDKVGPVSRLDGVRLNVVVVCAVEDDNHTVAPVQCDGEITRLVAVQLACDVCSWHADVIGAVVERCLMNRLH